MTYRNANYAAFYVAEPFSSSSLGALATKDFCHYNLLKMWKGKEASFPFIDAHDKTYNVRDDSDWEKTLKPRLRERLRSSKNIVLFLSSATLSSRALREEIEYGVNDQGLPVIVIYPEYDSNEKLIADGALKKEAIDLWEKLPVFRASLGSVPTIHIPLVKDLIKRALVDEDLMISTKKNGLFFFP